MTYTVQIMASALKALGRLPRADQERIRDRIDALAFAQRPAGVAKMSGTEALYRIRVGDYRVVYQVRDEALLVLVIRVGHRKDVYRQR
jgi:mRNA interferase RelE/StbE